MTQCPRIHSYQCDDMSFREKQADKPKSRRTLHLFDNDSALSKASCVASERISDFFSLRQRSRKNAVVTMRLFQPISGRKRKQRIVAGRYPPLLCESLTFRNRVQVFAFQGLASKRRTQKKTARSTRYSPISIPLLTKKKDPARSFLNYERDL